MTYSILYTQCTKKLENTYPGILVCDLRGDKVCFDFL